MRSVKIAAWILLPLVLATGARAAGVEVDLHGLTEEQRAAVLSTLQLNDFRKRDISAAEL